MIVGELLLSEGKVSSGTFHGSLKTGVLKGDEMTSAGIVLSGPCDLPGPDLSFVRLRCLFAV